MTDIAAIVKHAIANHEDSPPTTIVDDDTTFDELLLDSLDIVSIEIEIDAEIGGFDLNELKFWDRPDTGATTVGEFIALVESTRKPERISHARQ